MVIKRSLLKKYKGKHEKYWRSRRLIQRSLFDFVDDDEFLSSSKKAEPGFRLFSKQIEW